ncbi:helix-turn-helix transcriptional regulator [Nocardioides kongjuensis]|uniref:Proteasome accessory factor C n=1 Tax=Nocardioides kongjuensis TaxID=349522 RepID=A0A852RLP5_9ACTN|nr:WYL domain-containing protein [Nocardioides kongjuensis]NYD29790.1 proteasome accessory factor C [Nocardioides kongjuensis]
MSRTPAPGARDQVARLLTLVPFLHHRDGVRLEEAAQLLGTTPKQVVQDLKVLFMCGLPGGLPDDLIDVDLDAIVTEEGSPVTEGVIRVENADYLARPLRLSATEASAMIVALRMLRDTAAAGANPELVDRVLAKLEAAAGAPHVEITPSPRDAQQVVAAQLTALVDQAVATGRQLRLLYFVPSRDEESERVVDPYGVVTHGVFSYLDAHCHRAEGERLFRLDRITKAELLPTSRTVPARAPRDLSDGLFTDDAAPDATIVTLRLEPPARWATDYYPMRDVRANDDGSAEVDLVVVDRRWLTRLLLRLAPHATVVHPSEFTDTFTARAQETLSLYR